MKIKSVTLLLIHKIGKILMLKMSSELWRNGYAQNTTGESISKIFYGKFDNIYKNVE